MGVLKEIAPTGVFVEKVLDVNLARSGRGHPRPLVVDDSNVGRETASSEQRAVLSDKAVVKPRRLC